MTEVSGQYIRDNIQAMIISELHLLEVEREFLKGDAAELD